MSTISVIIPVYNGEKTISETIQSVLDQTFSDFELIVIDDSSRDATLEAVSNIKDSRLKVFSYPNAGPAASRNRGFSHSVGKYISFIDADDLWTRDKLEAQHTVLEENPQAALVYSWTKCIDETGKFLRNCSYVTWTEDAYSKLLLDDFIGTGSNVMVRREAFAAVNGFDESLGSAEDTDLWLRLAARSAFAVVPVPQILYRISSQSLSSNLLKMEEANLRVIERAFAEAPQSFQHLKPYAIANLYKYLSYKSLDTSPGQQQTLTILRFIGQVVKTDPPMIRTPIIPKALLKLAIMTFLPSKQAQTILARFPHLSNTSTFMGYEKLDVT